MNIRPLIALSTLGCAALLAAASHAASQQITKVETVGLTFPPKPSGLTNPPTIGQPVFIVNGNLTRGLGGSDVTNLVVSSIGNLLVNSERFILTYAARPQYECRVTLNDLEIKQLGKGTKGGAGDAVRSWFTNLIKINLNGKPTKVDWSKDEVQMSVRCGVSMQIIDSSTKNVFSGMDGAVNKIDTTKNIHLELAGLTFGKTETNIVTTNTISFESRLVQLASYYALTNMLPRLDGELAKLPVLAPKPKDVESDEHSTPKPNGSVVAQLKELTELLNQKLITQAEFEGLRKKILETFAPSTSRK